MMIERSVELTAERVWCMLSTHNNNWSPNLVSSILILGSGLPSSQNHHWSVVVVDLEIINRVWFLWNRWLWLIPSLLRSIRVDHVISHKITWLVLDRGSGNFPQVRWEFRMRFLGLSSQHTVFPIFQYPQNNILVTKKETQHSSSRQAPCTSWFSKVLNTYTASIHSSSLS